MKLFIITGGSRGLGHALCEQFKSRDYRIIEFSRSAPHEYSIQADLADSENSRRIVKEAIAPIDDMLLEELIVVSNAGTLEPVGPTSSKSYSNILKNINTNFASPILVLTEVIDKFQAAACRKVILNISSGAALKGRAGWSLYCAAKAGMENFIRSLALEQQAQPQPFIPINIDPGVIDTDMQAFIRTSSPSDFPDVEVFIQRKNQRLLQSPDNAAAAILRILKQESLSFGERYKTSDYDG
ncbi:MAG TPA: SDR family NAD(P)-dependent oxidoreductase [Anaerolineales bacterium]|nr:SDR family NAD(P)-dependent oxidoreductase [Anaerolineales bacterium]